MQIATIELDRRIRGSVVKPVHLVTEIQDRLWLIKSRKPEKKYVTWSRLSGYLGLYSVTFYRSLATSPADESIQKVPIKTLRDVESRIAQFMEKCDKKFS